MNGNGFWTCMLLGVALSTLGGCHSENNLQFHDSREHAYQGTITQIEYPELDIEHRAGVAETPPPQTVLSPGQPVYWPITLEQAVQIALGNSRAMRDIGGMVVAAPAAATTVFDPAIHDTDPRGGTEAALSAFDAQFSTSMFWRRTDLWFNNELLGLLTNGNLVADTADFQAKISKVAETGTQFSLSNLTFFDRDNMLLNQYPYSYNTMVQMEVRQPLLQGAGLEFNRIAGPGAKPGSYNGVLIARVNTDIGLADFETSVRDMLYNVERTYWELYEAYRDLDARQAGREAALTTWRSVQRKFEVGVADSEQEARAREQYYRFDSQVINALSGVTAAGQTSGAAGVYALERRLRWQLGLSASDGRLIRPAEEPISVTVAVDWCASVQEALCRRVELRRQKWMIKRREMELTAAKNFLNVRLDAVAQYGLLGGGEDLFGTAGVAHSGAVEDLFADAHQEYELGLQLTTPIGNRIGHTAVRNAELLVSRERAIYHEQELGVLRELSDAVGEMDRGYAVTRSLYNGRLAAHQQSEEIRKKYDAGTAPLEFVLEAQQRAVEADSAYYQSLVQYNLAIAGLHRARGSLLDYYNVYLNEGPTSDDARRSAAKQARHFGPTLLNYCFMTPPPVSRGVYAQRPLSMGPAEGSAGTPPPMPQPPVQPQSPAQPQPQPLAPTPAPPVPQPPLEAAPTQQTLPPAPMPPPEGTPMAPLPR